MTRPVHILCALFFAASAGCAVDVARLDDPTLDGDLAGAGLHQVSRAEWEAAPAGCEDAPFAELHLAGCEGEPTLGALLDSTGKVVCVDALSVLRDELAAAPEDSLAADPSPQPSRPPPVNLAAARPIQSQVSMKSTRGDPTPTPVVQGDPTPTPVTNPDLFVYRPERMERPPEEDPTPTPTMEE